MVPLPYFPLSAFRALKKKLNTEVVEGALMPVFIQCTESKCCACGLMYRLPATDPQKEDDWDWGLTFETPDSGAWFDTAKLKKLCAQLYLEEHLPLSTQE